MHTIKTIKRTDYKLVVCIMNLTAGQMADKKEKRSRGQVEDNAMLTSVSGTGVRRKARVEGMKAGRMVEKGGGEWQQVPHGWSQFGG